MVQERDDIVGSTRRSSCTRRSGTPPATSRTSPTRWSTAKKCKHALPRRPDRRGDRLPELRRRAHRAAAVQPDVQDARRPGRGRRRTSPICGPRRRRASSSTSRTCWTRCGGSCRSASRRSASRSATRSRRELHLPRPRVRADGDRVLRPARHRRRVVRLTGSRSARRWYTTTRHRGRRTCACASTRGRAVALLASARRHRVPLPVGWGELEGIANRTRLRPRGAQHESTAARS